MFDGDLLGEVFRVTSANVSKDGKTSDENSFEYREIDEETRSSGVNLFFDEAAALFGKRTDVKTCMIAMMAAWNER